MLKIRCSSIGKIMAKPKLKSETISQGAKTYLEELAVEELWGKRKDFSSKYTDKGNECEDEGIRLAEKILDVGFMYKNEEHFTNEYLTGTPDINTNVLIDIKSSWDATTFPFNKTEIPNKLYYWQLMGYMALTGKTKATLCYCLINTPAHLVVEEVRKAHYQLKKIEEDSELTAHIENQHNFDIIPEKKRLKTYSVEYDQTAVDEIYERIKACRIYYNELIKNGQDEQDGEE
jgi:hypothetical protein